MKRRSETRLDANKLILFINISFVMSVFNPIFTVIADLLNQFIFHICFYDNSHIYGA